LETQRWPAWVPLTGILFVALAVLAFIITGETPGTEDSPQEILDFYKDNDSESIWSAVLLGWGAVAFLFFNGALRASLRAAEGAPGWLSAVAFGGGLVFAAGALSFAGFSFALGDTADDLTPEAAQALNALNSDFFFLVAAGTATLLIATAIISIRSRMLPAWLAWIALLLGIVSVTPLGFFAFLLFLVWTVIVSVLLWRSAAAAAGTPPAPPPPTTAA
jgi:hypothetical protein